MLPENTHLISKSSDQVPVDDSMAPIQTESERIIGAILVFRDATRRKENEAALLKSERQLLQAQRMEAFGRLAGGVAHDFNNLLTVINGYADLLFKQIDGDNPVRSGIEEIRKAGQQATGLTRQLLAFSRGQPLKLEVIDLNQVVANFEAMLRRLIGEDMELVTILTGEPLCVTADVGQIEQVIMNLAANARDAMPGGGTLTLETAVKVPDENLASQAPDLQPVRHAVLSVSDTGIGIDPHTRRHMLEPFSPPRMSARVPVWVCQPSTASLRNTMAKCASTVSPDKAPHSRCISHELRPCRKNQRRRFLITFPKGQRPFCWWRTTPRYANWHGRF